MERIRRRVPVDDYLRPQKRFAHLFTPACAATSSRTPQGRADRNIARFGLLGEAEEGS